MAVKLLCVHLHVCGIKWYAGLM